MYASCWCVRLFLANNTTLFIILRVPHRQLSPKFDSYIYRKPHHMRNLHTVFYTLTFCILTVVAVAQQGKVFTAADYARAESQLYYNTGALVDNGPITPNWLPGKRFWYRMLTPTGGAFVLVDADKGSRTPAFDHQKLAAAITTATYVCIGTQLHTHLSKHIPVSFYTNSRI